MARSDPQLNLRIPLELKERVESVAKESGRSVTSEILKRLEASLDKQEGLSSFDGLSSAQIQAVNLMIRTLKHTNPK